MIGQPHILSVTDIQRGIQSLAARLLGDASAWTELVSANNLIPPYITTNPSEVYGPPSSVVFMESAISADADQIQILNQPQSTNRIYIASAGASGLVAESVGVQSYDGTTFKLATPLKNNYNKGAKAQLFSTYVSGSTNVLLPGDVIYLPLNSTNTNFTINSQSKLTDVFGSDIAFPISFSNGSLTTIQGLNVAKQRFVMALQTALRSVPLHLDIGSQLNQGIGTGSSTTKWSALVRDALMKLPEVSDVKNISTTRNGSTLYINCDVYVNTSETAIELRNEALTLIGSN